MCPTPNNTGEPIDVARRTAVIDSELTRLNIDLACLQETRLSDSGSVREANYTFFWQGKPSGEPRQHGVGFAVKNTLLSVTEPPSTGTERILSLRISKSSGVANIISAYAPTLGSTTEEKDRFYQLLDRVISSIPKNEALYLLGDFNARVGSDHEAWPSCLGLHGRGNINENGQRLLEFCCLHQLCVTNTYFNCKEIHQVSWRHPRSGHWHQLDLVITRRADLASVLLTRSYHSADCDTDHSLVLSKVRIQPKKLHHAKFNGRCRINVCSLSNPQKTRNFQEKLEQVLTQTTQQDESIDAKWSYLRDAVYNSSLEALGKKERKNTDWFEAHIDEMKPVTEAKRQALLSYKKCPNVTSLDSLRSAKKHAQQTARRCANVFWSNLSHSIQIAADTGNTRGLFDGIKMAIGPTKYKHSFIKSRTGELIKERGKQLERWVEHYLDLYATQNVVTDSALDATPQLPVMEELDKQPSVEELQEALRRLACGKAPGSDGILPEVLKCAEPILLKPLHELLCLCWDQGHIPQDMRDSKIVTLYKNKGDRSDCNNYRGVSLLSVVGKTFARVALTRLQNLASRIYPESQCGFRAGRSTTDMIFSLRQLQEKCTEQQMPLYIAFIDLTKAFDMVSRSGLYKLLEKIGCPPHLLAIIKSFHDSMQSTVSFNGTISESFPVSSGVKQGCVLAPTLFGIFFSMLLRHAFKDCSEGVYMHTREDGGLFNIARLRAKSKTTKVLLRELLFADDAALVSHTENGLQQLVLRFSDACKEFGLTISLKKTNVMVLGSTERPNITIDGFNLEPVSDFTYLGSTISNTPSVDLELNRRIAKATAVMARLNHRVWKNPHLTQKTKLRVYQACVLSTLLYGSETWTAYARHERKLNSLHLRFLRRILNIQYIENIPNSEELRRGNMPSMFAILSERRLRWIGHVKRMQNGRIPKDLLYGELAVGSRPSGRPQLRYKDICNRDMKLCHIDIGSWECIATNRTLWRSSVRSGVQNAEAVRIATIRQKRAWRKGFDVQPRQPTQFTCSTCNRDCHSRIGLYSHSRKCF